MIFLLLFLENRRTFHANCLLRTGDNLHAMSKPIFLEKQEKYFKMSSAEIFTLDAKH